MKKPNNKTVTAAKIVAGIATAFMVAANVSGCVYGPPADDSSDESKKPQESAQVEDDYEPDDNMNGDVYGPPPG